MTDRPQKIAFGELRDMGVPGVLIYYANYKCSHSIAVVADHWADDLRLSDIEDRFTCSACGKRGADVRPDFNWNSAISTASPRTKPSPRQPIELHGIPNTTANAITKKANHTIEMANSQSSRRIDRQPCFARFRVTCPPRWPSRLDVHDALLRLCRPGKVISAAVIPAN